MRSAITMITATTTTARVNAAAITVTCNDTGLIYPAPREGGWAGSSTAAAASARARQPALCSTLRDMSRTCGGTRPPPAGGRGRGQPAPRT